MVSAFRHGRLQFCRKRARSDAGSSRYLSDRDLPECGAVLVSTLAPGLTTGEEDPLTRLDGVPTKSALPSKAGARQPDGDVGDGPSADLPLRIGARY
jgi:hypothetical protein